MELKIIETTDNKYVGEVVVLNEPPKTGDVIVYKDTKFPIEKMEIKDNIIILYCSNYIAKLQILEQ